MGVTVIQGTAVVSPDNEEPGGFGVKARKNVANGEEIAQALGHFFVVAGHKAVVHPDAGQGLTGRALALRDLIFMVRELQVGATAVDVDAITQ